MNILHIETATKNCSVSLGANGNLLVLKEFNDNSYSHAEKLHALISTVLKDADLNFSDLSAIAVSQGPGSYTGLRIGISAAKGLCFALDIPLIAVPTLEILSNAVNIESGVKVPMIDARRLEVYSAVYNKDTNLSRDVEAEIISENSFKKLLDEGTVHFFGDGAEKCKTIISHSNAKFIDDVFPSANEMVALAHKKYVNKAFESVAYFEPFYLKDFVVTKPKKSISPLN